MQNVIALIIVAAALTYLGLRGWKFFSARKSSPGCASGCGSCSVTDKSKAQSLPLVTIAPLEQRSS